jgi:hypothetical protein
MDRPATMSEAAREFAANACNPETCTGWILSPFDSWEKCPHYAGQPHPEDFDYDEPATAEPKPTSRFDIKVGQAVMVTLRDAEVPATVRVVDPLGMFRVEIGGAMTWIDIANVHAL